MSILQEYEEIKKQIGQEKWDSIDMYIHQNPNLTFDKIIYNKENYSTFENWFYKEIKLQKIDVLNIWTSDYDDICCNAILYKNDNPVANIIASYDEPVIRYNIGDNDSILDETFVKSSITSLIYDAFEEYLKLPKISECSKLLIEIYDCVCSADSSMCHIDSNDWEDLYSDDFNEEDIKILQKEIIKYNLQEVVTVDDGEYKIVGYGDLQTRFNDDRDFKLNKENTEVEI